MQIHFPNEILEREAAGLLAIAETEKRAGYGNSTTRRGPAYRLATGVVRPVYDPYRASYPRDAEPGFADITQTLQFYPNETSGYVFSCSNFEPLP